MKKFREEFTVYQDANGEYFGVQNKEKTLKEIKLAVQRPNHKEQEDAQFIYQKFMNKCLKEGVMPRIKLEEVCREQGIWDDKKQKEEKELADFIIKTREQLKKGGIKKSEMEKLVNQSIEANFKFLRLNRERYDILNNSAESMAENYRFNYLVSAVTVYSHDGKKVFKDYDDFLKQDNLGNPVPYISGMAYARLMNNLDDDFRKDWPEYKFLQKYGYVNDKLQRINNEGQLVDDDGKVMEPVDESVVENEELVAEFLPD